MKRTIVAILACALLLASCGTAKPSATTAPTAAPTAVATVVPDASATAAPVTSPAPTKTVELPKVTPFLTLDEYPAMDGSTANLPLMAAVMASATGISYEEAVELTTCTTTPYAYTAMLNGDADILLVYEGSGSTQKELAESSVKLKLTPVGRDALVFIVNEQNPVSSLTQQQLTDIYTGKIKNWKEVGGEDMAIEAYQRVEASGSQALFIKLLMKDTEPMKAPSEYYPSGMGDLIEKLAEYNNQGNALGFSVFYYANYMYSKPGLKFIGVDGVAPSDETIASSQYPLLNEFYVVIRETEPADSPAHKLYDWLQTDEAKAVIKAAGYIPV